MDENVQGVVVPEVRSRRLALLTLVNLVAFDGSGSLTSPKSELLIPSNFSTPSRGMLHDINYGGRKSGVPLARSHLSANHVEFMPAVRVILGEDHDDCVGTFSRR